MAEFLVNKDMFGRYCRIPTDTSGNMHFYKIVSRIDSNGYCDVPLTWQSEAILHKQVVPVLLVIHCGIDESKVQRVALSDCEIVPADVAEVKHGEWIYHECVSSYDGTISGYSCSVCKTFVREETFDNDTFNKKYCGHCGARMSGKDG